MIKLIYYTFKKDLKSSFRSKRLIFWAFIFPLLFIFIFSGMIKHESVKYSIIIVNKDRGNLSKLIFSEVNKSGIFEFKYIDNLSEALNLLNSSYKYDAIIYIPENFTRNITSMKKVQLNVFLNIRNPSWAQSTLSVISSTIERINKEISNRTISITLKYIPKNVNYGPFPKNNISFKSFLKNYLYFISSPIELKVNTYYQNNIDIREMFVYAMIAMDVVIISLILSSVLLSYEIEKRTIRRFTFNKKIFIAFITSKVLVSVFVVFLAMCVILFVSHFVYGIKYSIENLLYPIVMFLISTLFMSSIGLIIGLIFKSKETSSSIALMIGMILAFTTGIFIPTKFLPKILQDISQVFPTSIILNNIYGSIFLGLNTLNITNLKNIYVVAVSFLSVSLSILIVTFFSNKIEF